MKLELERPIVFFDLETTGLNPYEDKIVEICVIKLMPDGSREVKTRRINPGVPIPQECTDVHGISNEDVEDCPNFAALANGIFDFFKGSDVGGYNIINFDLPMLTEEFKRCELTLNLAEFKIVDIQKIFFKREPRTLAAAMKFYCNEEIENAHSAEADVEATIKVMEGQFQKYEDLPRNPDEISLECRDERWADALGKLCWSGKDVALNFGNKKGSILKDMAKYERGYLEWMIKKDFPEDTKEILRNALKGEFLTKD